MIQVTAPFFPFCDSAVVEMTVKPSDMTPVVDLTHGKGAGPVRAQPPIYVDLLPPCNHACPAGENIQAWLDLAQAGKYRQAWEALMRDNPMPAVHGRVCYHPCEGGCNRGDLDAPVSIHAVERFLGDLASAGRLAVQDRTPAPSGKRVLVVGAGPSGLSAAYHLARLGHAVEIHEAGPLPGGMLHFGIPAYRLPRDRSDGARSRASRRWACGSSLNHKVDDLLAEKHGGKFRRRLHRDRRAASASTSTSRRATRRGCSTRSSLLREVEAGEPPRLGRRVVVYGGGNTAMDAARTAQAPGRRRGADRLPARPRAHAGARVRGRRGARGRRQDQVADHHQGDRRAGADRRDDGTRRRGPPAARPGKFETLQADAVVLALGQETDSGFLRNVPGIAFTADGTVIVGPDMMTGHPGIFAGGDMVPGERTGHGRGRPRQDGGAPHRRLAARRALSAAGEARRW